MYVLQANDIYKSFGQLKVLKGVSLEVKGRSNCYYRSIWFGKSTLLRCLNRLETIDRGTITITGEYMVKSEKTGGQYTAVKRI